MTRRAVLGLAAIVSVASASAGTMATAQVGGLAVGTDRDPPTPAQVRASTPRRGGSAPRPLGRRMEPRRGGKAKPFPSKRLVGVYGAPQLPRTAVGKRGEPVKVGKLLRRQARAYKGVGRLPVIRAVDLVSTIATAGPGPSGLYRSRQEPAVINRYLKLTRGVGGRLILDVQPGRSSFMREVRHLEPWLTRNRVDVALDAEWNVGPRGVPGEDNGSVTAAEVNAISGYLNRLVKRLRLRAKVLVIHQFARGSVRRRGQIRQRPNVQVTLSFDGSGGPDAKIAGYESLRSPALFDGFALFYERDDPLLRPNQVLRLEHPPHYVFYQ